MQNINALRFDQAVSSLGDTAQRYIINISEQEKAEAYEIRFRCGSRAALTLPSGIKETGGDVLTREAMDRLLLNMCDHSMYSRQNELINGYITLRGGHRAGVCGTAVITGGRVTAVRDITTINIRIARERAGCANEILDGLFASGLCGAILAGPPCSGKTTLLRDIAEALSTGREIGKLVKKRRRVAVIDERGEMAAVCDGISQNRIGLSCDILNGYPKSEGMMQAVRSLSPEIIICDEIGSFEDIRAVELSANAGVTMICSVHAGSARELYSREQTKALLATGAFKGIAVLKAGGQPGRLEKIIRTEKQDEDYRRDFDNNLLGAVWA